MPTDTQPFEIGQELADLVVPIEDLVLFPGNPRRGDIELIKESLRENGQYKPITVRAETDEILVGNHTTRAALELGATRIAATRKSVPSDEAARRIMLADNATSDRATYDHRALAEQLEKLVEEAGGREGLKGSGFDEAEFTRVLNRANVSATPHVPEPQPRPKKPTTRPGDLIQLGEHKLLCGDATKRADVKRLLGSEQIDMVWTDPPYGIDYEESMQWRDRFGAGRHKPREDGTTRNAFKGDLPKVYEALVRDSMLLAREATRPGGAFYLAHAASMSDPTSAAIAAAGWEWRQTLCWVKNTATFGRQDYQWRHEAIAYGWKPGKHHWYGDHNKTTVFDGTRADLEALEKPDLVELAWQLLEATPSTVVRIDRPRSADLHPTMKPPDLVAKLVANSCQAGGLVYEPFGGSGTTLVAAESIDRRSRVMELEPAYCDVIVNRWQEMTGQKAKRPARRATKGGTRK